MEVLVHMKIICKIDNDENITTLFIDTLLKHPPHLLFIDNIRNYLSIKLRRKLIVRENFLLESENKRFQ